MRAFEAGGEYAAFALIITAACAAIVSVVALVGSSGAQLPGPPTGTLELVSLDQETRFTFVDNPPRRRERAGDLFMIIAGCATAPTATPAGCTRRSLRRSRRRVWSRRDPRPSFSVMVSGPIVDRPGDRTDTFAVVGGSGAYTAARGTMVTTEMRRRTRFVFTFAG